MDYGERNEAKQAVRDVVDQWGLELVMLTVAERVRETHRQEACPADERRRMWAGLKSFLHDNR